MNHLFELQQVTKMYGKIRALHDLTVQAPMGAIGLLGPNGAGKTTMIRTLLGLISINNGSGKVLGLDIKRDPLTIRQKVGFVPEDECLFPGTAGIEFVAYAGELGGMASSDAMQRAHEVLDYVGLGEARYRATDSYSTGMKQRLKLGAALVHDPKLLIMDEPTNGMDPPGRDDLIELARDLCRNKGISLLYSSHLLPDVEAVCDYVIVMGRGKVLTQGKITDLKMIHQQAFEVRVKVEQDRFKSRLVELGCEARSIDDHLIVTLPENRDERMLWELANQESFQIRHLRPRRSTLEDVFLEAIGK
ncbi:MAG: ABC transporter ATP-binding protein [Planctomycetia bacterium]|nr:ABC transporter ATP-binding protein [Planctomycetia bacterium]